MVEISHPPCHLRSLKRWPDSPDTGIPVEGKSPCPLRAPLMWCPPPHHQGPSCLWSPQPRQCFWHWAPYPPLHDLALSYTEPPLWPWARLPKSEMSALIYVYPQVWNTDLFYNCLPLLPSSFLGLLAFSLIHRHPRSWNVICKYGNLCTRPTLLISLELFIKISLAFPTRPGSTSCSTCRQTLPAR